MRALSMDLPVEEIGITRVQQPALLGPGAGQDSYTGVSRAVTWQRHQPELLRQVRRSADRFESEPILSASSLMCLPMRSVRPLHLAMPAAITAVGRPQGGSQSGPKDVDRGPRKVREPARVIAVEMRQDDMAYVLGRVSKAHDLTQRGLLRVQDRADTAQEPLAQAVSGICDVLETDSGVDQNHAFRGFHEEAVTDEGRRLRARTFTVD